jgi:hypothetical protein
MYIIFNYVTLCRLLYVLFFLLFSCYFSSDFYYYYDTIISIIFSIIFDYVTDSHPNLEKLADDNSRPMRWLMTVKCPWAPAKLRDEQGTLLYQAKSTFEAERPLLYALFLYNTYYFDCLTRIEQLVTAHCRTTCLESIRGIMPLHQEEISHCWQMGPIHAMLFYIICIMSLLFHIIPIISKIKKCNLGAYSLQKTC